MQNFIHVIPNGDIKPHEENSPFTAIGGCPCSPKFIEENGVMIVVHNAFDGREWDEEVENIIKQLNKGDTTTGYDTTPSHSTEDGVGYWQKRCEAAEDYIKLTNKDYSYEQDAAYKKWQKLKNKQS